MWQLTVSELENKAVFRGQQILHMGTIKAKIKNIFVRGKKVNSAFVTPSTVPIIRSESARYVFFIQMSREMWEYDAEGSGEITYSKVINGFLPDLFKRWQKLNVRHLVSIIIFARVEYEKGILKDTHTETPVRRTWTDQGDDKDYRDFYRVVTTDMASADWILILHQLKREFNSFLRDVLLVSGDKAYGRLPDSLADVGDHPPVECVIAGQLTLAADGNVLEAISLASVQFAHDYIDRDLVRTGISLAIITAGTGIYHVDYDMLKLTTDTLVGNGIGIDLIALSPMPLHSVPLFRYRTPTAIKQMMSSTAVGSYGELASTPRNFFVRKKSSPSPVKIDRYVGDHGLKATSVNNRGQWSFAIPHWIDVSFWTSEKRQKTLAQRNGRRQTQRRARQGDMYTTVCRMYELQMMGLMEIELADISIPLLSAQIDPKIALSKVRPTYIDRAMSNGSSLLLDYNKGFVATTGAPMKQIIGDSREVEESKRLVSQWMQQYDQNVFKIESEMDSGSEKEFQAHARNTSATQRLYAEDSVATGHRDSIDFDSAMTKPEGQTHNRNPSDSATRNSFSTQASPKRPKAMTRQISLGFKRLGPTKAVASTKISSANVVSTGGITDTFSGDLTLSQTSTGLLTQQFKNTLRNKASERSLLDIKSIAGQPVMSNQIQIDKKVVHVPAIQTQSTTKRETHTQPINIVHDTPQANNAKVEDSSSLAEATLRPTTFMEVSNTVRRASPMKHPRPSPLLRGKSSAGKLKSPALNTLTPLNAMSPWLTLLNPSNPRKDNVNVASQFRRWQHVFPRHLTTSAIKWKSLCSPAALPLSIDYFPSREEIKQQYNEFQYVVRLPTGEDTGVRPVDGASLLRQLLAARISNGFQFVTGQDALRFVEPLGLTLIDCFKKDLTFAPNHTVLLSIGDDYHQLQCQEDNEVLVRRFVKKSYSTTSMGEESAKTVIEYAPRLRTIANKFYVRRDFQLQNPRAPHDWKLIDGHAAGWRQDMPPELCFWRARFVLLPVEIPKNARNLTAGLNEVSDEETRLEGIQKLTQLWQRHRYLSPSEKRYQASLQQKFKDANPLAIDYQTRDMSAVARAAALGSLDASVQGEGQAQLFAESDLYHTSDFDMQKVAQHVQADPPKGISMVDRRWHLKTYNKCLRGDELTTWLVTNFKDVDTRENAVKLGNELMKKGMITHVRARHRFRDGNYFYQIAQDFRITAYPDTRPGWFSRMTDRSVPTTPAGESIKASPMSDRPLSRHSRDDSADSSTSQKPPVKIKPLELSRMLQIDVDPKGKSWRPEVMNLHYDRVHNPDNCYHIRIEWINVTAKFIEDTLITWTAYVEKYGLRLIELPVSEISRIADNYPFRACVQVKLASLPPPYCSRQQTSPFMLAPALEDPLYYHKLLLRKWDFILDYEAASAFDPSVPISYSWSPKGPDQQYTQFIHRSGILMVQVDRHGHLLCQANRLSTNRQASTRDMAKFETSERLTNDRKATAYAQKASPYGSPLARAADITAALAPPSPIITALTSPYGLSNSERTSNRQGGSLASTGIFSSLNLGPSAASITTANMPSPNIATGSRVPTPASSSHSQSQQQTVKTIPSTIFVEGRMAGRPMTIENLTTAVEEMCHSKVELDLFWHEAARSFAAGNIISGAGGEGSSTMSLSNSSLHTTDLSFTQTHDDNQHFAERQESAPDYSSLQYIPPQPIQTFGMYNLRTTAGGISSSTSSPGILPLNTAIPPSSSLPSLRSEMALSAFNTHSSPLTAIPFDGDRIVGTRLNSRSSLGQLGSKSMTDVNRYSVDDNPGQQDLSMRKERDEIINDGDDDMKHGNDVFSTMNREESHVDKETDSTT